MIAAMNRNVLNHGVLGSPGFAMHHDLSQISYELNCRAIPFEDLAKAIESLPYAKSEFRLRLMYEFLTGCRMQEASDQTVEGAHGYLRGNWVYWQVGKNQDHGWRKEYLPSWWLEEWMHYRKDHKVIPGKFFSMSPETYGREFNKKIRPLFGEAWQARSAVPRHIGGKVVHEYLLQLKGCRKSFATCVFWQAWEKYGSAHVASEMTCKRLRHSNKGITVQHYIEDSDRLNRERWGGYSPAEILQALLEHQTAISEYEIDYELLQDENAQDRLHDYF